MATLFNTVIGGTTTTLYTSSATSPQLGNAITCMMLCNTGSASTNVTLYAVPSGSNAGASTTIVSALAIPAGETVSLDQEKLVLSNGDVISGISSNVSTAAVTFTISVLPV
jgi:hypothetical protein